MRVEGKAKLIRYTSDPERTVAMSAKLCYSDMDIDALIADIESKDTAKFIKLLLSLGHLSPLEHASFTFSIEGVSRALLAQITRHRIASFSVKSQRYVSAHEFCYIVPPSIEALGSEQVDEFARQMDMMENWYHEWQEKLGGASERANEDARFVLPNACETKMIVTMNARELLHFFNLRCCERAQWEIRNIAWQMLAEVIYVAPNLFASAGASCVSGACAEGKLSCGKSAQIRSKQKDLLDNSVKLAILNNQSNK